MGDSEMVGSGHAPGITGDGVRGIGGLGGLDIEVGSYDNERKQLSSHLKSG